MVSLIYYQFNHLNLKLSIFCRDTASFEIEISKVHDFEISPVQYIQWIVSS